MTRVGRLVIVGVTLIALSTLGGQAASPQAGAVTDAMSAAAKASPELIGSLSKEIGASPEVAAGAAGALFGVAKSKLKPAEFSQVSKAVPGMDMLLKAAPAMGGAGGAMAAMAGGGAGNLAAAASAFSKLGLSPDMISKAVPVLTQFVTKSGGANVGKLLAGVLK
ncbi:MAG TPA: DUF2780 domain-containing protein [Vicinamibacterales bacterium]|nr:DUF2780 domain-containing protein [Vicinamibacterales bacterium]